MFGLTYVEIGVLVVFVAIVILFVANMTTEKKEENHKDGEK